MKSQAMQTKAVERARYILGDARYAEHHRVRGWNIEPTVLEDPRLFKGVFPELSKDDHLARAKMFQAKARKVEAQWLKRLGIASKLYGEHGAYVSGIYREHFPEVVKEVLRRLAHGSTLLFKAANAHWTAAGKRGPIQVFPKRDPARERYQLPRHKDSPHRWGGGIIGRTTGKQLHETSAESWRHSAEQIMAAVKAAYPSMKRLPAAAKADVARAREFLRRAKLHEKRAGSKVTARASRRLLEAELWKIWPRDFKLTGPGPRSIRMKTKDGYLDSKLSDLSDDEILHLLHPAHRDPAPAGRRLARERVNSKQSVLGAGRRSSKKQPSRRDPARAFRGAKVVSINIVANQSRTGGDTYAWTANAFNKQRNVVYSATRTTPERAFLAVANGVGYGPEAFEKVTPNHYLLKAGTKRDPAWTAKEKAMRKWGETGLVRCRALLQRITKVAEQSVRSKRIGTQQSTWDSEGDWELVENLKKVAQKAGCSALQISKAVKDGVQFGRKATLGETYWPKSRRRDPAYVRKTETLHVLQGNYGHGWEDLTAEKTRLEIKQRLKEYRENEGGNYRVVRKREKIARDMTKGALRVEARRQKREKARKQPPPKTHKRRVHLRDPAFKACPIGTEVQSLILDQSHFDTRDAMGWAKRHGFRVSKVDTTEHSYRFRQKEPSTFVHDSFRTITMRPGVKAVIGCPK